MRKTVFINFFILLALIAAFEGFFALNHHLNLIENPFSKQLRKTYQSSTGVLQNYGITPDELNGIPYPHPDPNGPELAGKTRADLDYSSQFGKRHFDTHNLIFEDGVGFVLLKHGAQQIDLYRAEYNFIRDSARRNAFRTSSDTEPSAENFAIHFGDSFVFGEGNETSLTLPSILNRLTKNVNHYNFGLSGGSPASLYHLGSRGIDERFKHVTEKSGSLIYHYNHFHIRRVICTMRCYDPIERYRVDFPEYKLRHGEIVLFNDRFSDNPKFNYFYRPLSYSYTLKFFNFDLPSKYTESDFELVVRLIAESFARYSKHLTVKRKILVIHSLTPEEHVQHLKTAAAKYGIETIDYSGIDYTKILSGYEAITLDGHPTARAQFLTARLLEKDLGTQF